MFISAILSALGLGGLIYLLFTLAVYALPFFVAVTVGMYVYDTDAGLIAAFVSAFFAGAITLIAGQIAFATIRSVPVRLAIGAVYASPAGIAGYHAIKGLSGTAARATPGRSSSRGPARSRSAPRPGHGSHPSQTRMRMRRRQQ